ncbi:hypothetical protein DNU06_00335 [Putridiphycobacter roseus]|uniref:Gliding motility protein GldM n=1 Tax=Putridiphycobacter roseus TaxID=2219161 RepID=A0A2W1N212_9FLAO|nr:GldM family protein [Putridiphycobacter roseus]PZE18317.1 hypothetical protein DNU06_00335 [Putridiphycobacter roseus]
MAGGKETPRQKMIGMMYLVLTALLAMNVSKQVIAAFITLNDKVEVSTGAIENKNGAIYQGFEAKKMSLKSTGGDVKDIEKWQKNATEVKNEADKTVGFLIGLSNEMIGLAEGGQDWIDHDLDVEIDGQTYPSGLKSLGGIQNFDNYDIPTNLFVGSDRSNPNEKGISIRTNLNGYRDYLVTKIGNYSEGKVKWTFEPPAEKSDLKAALASANPVDTSKIIQLYDLLNYPEEVHGHDEGAEAMPWVAAMFDHAPIVAAAAMFSALKSDVRNAESVAAQHMLDKVDAPMFNFNKIEPMAFAPSAYINQGDSLPLNVKIAAYDSTEIAEIAYGMDADTLPERWKKTTGTIGLSGATAGSHKVKGVIYVKQKGELVPKPWSFNYTVGQPMGVVALPEMRVLYRGYKNIVEGTASGFPADKVSLSGSGCNLSKSGKTWVATVGSGVREASISVIGRKDNGGSVNLGSFKFKVKKLPAPTVYLGGITNGQNPGLSSVKANANSKISCRYDESVPLTGVAFTVVSGTVTVDGLMAKGRVGGGGKLDGNAKKILAQSRGKQVTMLVTYRGPDGVSQRGALVFTPR